MGTMRTGYSSPKLRASDADRDAVLAQLTDSFQAGRLTSDEFDDRSGLALSARTVGELDSLLTDLPTAPLTGSGPAAASPPDYRTGPMPPRSRAPLAAAVVPLLVIVVGLAVVFAVVGGSGHHHGWDIWWVVPIAAIIARRVTRHHHGGGGNPQDLSRTRPRDW